MMNCKKCQCACFTGHRPEKFRFQYNENDDLCKKIKAAIFTLAKKLYIEMDVNCFWTGGAQGVDTWAAEAILDLKQQFPDIELFVAIPFPEYWSKWEKESIERAQSILSRCDGFKIISPEVQPSAGIEIISSAYKQRNYFMVEQCHFLIAVFNNAKNKPSRSGTWQTVNYAKKRQLQSFYIHPDTAEATLE